ncbi:hypothetical protein AB0M43_36470 [Longispora sp. NPDC051575]|uniref:hypothetical protein n=1 Tax=Longispora sp. NPDC051575 TaxID=3154943 RepID=UPI00341C9377
MSTPPDTASADATEVPAPTSRPARTRWWPLPAAVLALVLVGGGGLAVWAATAPARRPAVAVPVLPAPAEQGPWAQAGVTGMTVTVSGTVVELRVVQSESMADPAQVEQTMRRMAKIAWRSYAGPMQRLAITATTPSPPREHTAFYADADLSHTFGPRPADLDQGVPRPTPSWKDPKPAPGAPVNATEARKVLDDLFAATLTAPQGHPRPQPAQKGEDCDMPGGRRMVSVRVDLDPDASAEAQLVALVDLWTARGMDVFPDLDFGHDSVQARILTPAGAVLGNISARAQGSWLSVTVDSPCL